MKRLRVLALILILALLAGCSGVQIDMPGWPPVSIQTDAPVTHDGGVLEVHFLDVGQADCALIISGGSAMLIDGGNTADADLVSGYLDRQGVGKLDFIVCTHAHEDHAGGLYGVIRDHGADAVICSRGVMGYYAFDRFIKAAEESSAEITEPVPGDTFSLGGAEATVLGPIGEYEDMNDTSVVLRVVFGETAFLFTGDAGREAEADIIDAGYELGSTVLKVGHHGSGSATSYLWLREVAPGIAVISVGADNDYGHPSEAVLSRLRDAECEVCRTDLQGNIVIFSDGEDVTVKTDRYASPEELNPTAAG